MQAAPNTRLRSLWVQGAAGSHGLSPVSPASRARTHLCPASRPRSRSPAPASATRRGAAQPLLSGVEMPLCRSVTSPSSLDDLPRVLPTAGHPPLLTCRSYSTPALPLTHICFLSPESSLLSLVKRSRGPYVFTALTASSEAITGEGGDTYAGQPTLLNREPLISCLRSSPDKPSGMVLHHLPFLTQAPLPPVGKDASIIH